MNLEEVLHQAARRGVDVSSLVVGREPDQVPPAPSHRWIVFPSSRGGTVIGGVDRGRFAAYAEFTDLHGAADALRELTSPPPPRPLDQPRERVLLAARAIGQDWTTALRHQPTLPGTAVAVGTPLDHIGNESGHHLYLYGTSTSLRSLPTTDLQEPRTGYLVAQALPPDAVVERLPPWFGQPGGGLVVRLPRVIRYYVDTQVLLRFDPASLTPRPDLAPRRGASTSRGRAVGTEPLTSSTYRAEYLGRDLPCLFTGRGWVALGDDGGAFPDALDRGESDRSGPWVTVPGSTLQRRYRRDVSATWRDQRVEIDLVDNAHGVAGFWFTGDPAWARENGLKGAQQEGGFAGVAPVGEFTDVQVSPSDRPIPDAHPTTRPPAGTIPSPQTRATYADRELRVRSRNRDTIDLYDDGGPFPDAVERVSQPGDSFVSVPWASVRDLVRRSVFATWRGHRVSLVRVRDDHAGFWYSGDDISWAVGEGLDGSVRDGGFGGTALLSDLEDVEVVEVVDTEQPLPRRAVTSSDQRPDPPLHDDVQRELDALADALVRLGLHEGGDFFISGHRREVTVSSEYVALLRDPGRFLATYNDMGHETVLADTADLAVARAAFIRAVVDLGRGRGTQVTEQDLEA